MVNAHHATCPNCGRAFDYHEYHAGFGNQGFLYCDQDEAVLTWSSYDPTYETVVGQKPRGP